MKTTMLFLVAALAASAQTPVPVPFGECGFDGVGFGAPKADILEPNQFAIPRGDLCEMYTFEAGWEETMVLQLGEGAEEYRDLIEMAVEVWNEVVYIDERHLVPNRVPLIEISDEKPRNYLLSRSFWDSQRNAESVSSRNLRDSENVIYFKPDNGDTGPRGYTRLEATTYGNRIVEADVYINTDHEEEFGEDYGPSLGLTKLVANYDDDHGAYAIINATYIVILHELGHAIGLKHIPVTGNVMNKNFTPGLVEQWGSGFVFYFIQQFNYWGHTLVESPDRMGYVFKHGELDPYVVVDPTLRRVMETFTETARLGAQEKMMLACIYEY